MKRQFLLAAVAVAVAASVFAGASTQVAHAAATCTPTGLTRDSIDLTAALVNPDGTVSGTVDATGCNIGVYYGPGQTGTVKGATVENANYFGIVNDGGSVAVSNSTITEIGENPFNGTQHGVGIYWVYGSSATGTIKNNMVTQYQKGGIVVNGSGSSATVTGNTVTGLGPVEYIAQNGIQFGYGATGTVAGNTVSLNEYTGTNSASSGGILVVGGPIYQDVFTTGINITHNSVTNNDVGIWLSNAEADGSPPSTATNNTVVNNTITKDGLTNVSGENGSTCGYQAGIADEGNQDSLVNNRISGTGYVPGSVCNGDGTGTFSTAIDQLGTNHINNNR